MSANIYNGGIIGANPVDLYGVWGVGESGLTYTDALPAIKASGGTITLREGYAIHTFTGTDTFTPLYVPIEIEYIVIAGGGGGGTNASRGGGGAGGYRSSVEGENSGRLSPIEPKIKISGSVLITVGAAGAAVANGTPSSIGNLITSLGGARGGPFTGGSGGGGNTGGGAGGAGTAGQGFDGGVGATGFFNGFGGGGGGAGMSGLNAATNSGNNAGGDGIASDITFADLGPVHRAGGGGGGRISGGITAGGLGGGGSGRFNANAGNGSPNTGGGGGSTNSGAVGSGGSGTVIIRYLT